MYALMLPSWLLQSTVSPLWNLGDVYLTEGVMRCAEDQDLVVELYIKRHFSGDYGHVSTDSWDHARNEEAREDGQYFVSLYPVGEEILKVVTHPEIERTVLCLARED